MQYQRLFAHDDWANHEEVTHLRQIRSPKPAVRLLAHIVGADWLWIARIRGEKVRLSVWPELTIDQCAAEIVALRDTWRDILKLERGRKVEYRNTKGELWSSTLDEILTHVLLHSSYHRGQIATVVRQGGETPAYTDFIQAARSGAI